MADDMVVLQCEACSTRLKVRAVTARIMKDVKCPKCGKKVSTKSVAASAEAPAPPPAAAVAPTPAPAPTPEPAVEKAVEPAPAPVVAPAPVIAPLPVDDTELKLARFRVGELEKQVVEMTSQVAELTARVAALSVPPPASPAVAELAHARVIIAEQEERLTQLQQLWYEKEKEARTATTTAQRAQQERKQSLDQIEALLKAYHEAEIEAATDRINNLNVRLQNFMAQLAAKSTPG